MDCASRRSDAHHHWRKVVEYRTARADHGAPAYGDAGGNEDIGRQPGLVFNDNGKSLDIEAGGTVIVRAGTEVALLRNHNIVSIVILAKVYSTA